MLYTTLIAKIAAKTGLQEEDVRKVLTAFPEVVMECEEGEQVKTPLGAFKIIRRKRKKVRAPSGEWSFAPERLQARMRPGINLQLDLESSESMSVDLLLEEEDPDG